MRLGTTALVASAFFGLLYVTMPSASALPLATRADITTTKSTGITQQAHWRRWGGWGYRPYRFYRPYGFYHRPYRYYRPYRLYRPWGWRHRGHRWHRWH